MRVVSYLGSACIAMTIAAAPAAAAKDKRAYSAGHFALDIASGEGGFLAPVEKSGEGSVTIGPQDLLACKSFAGSICGPQQIIADTSDFNNGADIFDIIGFGYDPGNCCQFVFFYFPNEAFATKGFYQSIGQSPSATLQISAVPEPDSWALLIAGFGLIGASLRRRRHAAA